MSKYVMASKNMILVLACVLMPFLGISQDDHKHDISTEAIETIQVLEFSSYEVLAFEQHKTDIISLKRIERISEDPFEQSKSMHYSKSRAIISVKTLMKILHPKRKETVRS